MGRSVLSVAKLRDCYKNGYAVIFQDDNKIHFTNACTFGGDCNHKCLNKFQLQFL